MVSNYDLKAWRLRMGDLSRNQAAIKIGCSGHSIRAWEIGVTGLPTYIEAACRWHEHMAGIE